jgi:hypothetical protein
MSWFAAAHKAVAIAIALGVPLAVYLINGAFEAFSFPLGAVMGFCYWYFLDPIP